MKKTLFILALLIPLLSSYARLGDLENTTYFRLGLSMPTWNYYGAEGKSDFAANTKKTGGIFEVGSIFMINSRSMRPGMSLGVNVDYISSSLHYFYNDDEQTRDYNMFIGSKIGPSLSFEPMDEILFDVFAKLNPVWYAYTIKKDESYNIIDNPVQRDFAGYLALKYSAGFNIRYSLFILSFEYNGGTTKLKYLGDSDNPAGDTYLGNVSNPNKDRTPSPNFSIMIGMSF